MSFASLERMTKLKMLGNETIPQILGHVYD